MQLPIEKIEKGIVGLSAQLQSDPMVGAEGIMTTDTFPKALSARVGDATITWVAKGSGMIEPNMATMLAYIFTDAEFDSATLDKMLRAAVHVSFNMLSVDTDTSTSDCRGSYWGHSGQNDSCPRARLRPEKNLAVTDSMGESFSRSESKYAK